MPGVGLYPILHIPLQPALRYIMLLSDDCLKAMSGKYCRHLFSGLLGYINYAANLSFTLSPAIHKNGQQPRPPGRALSAAGRLPHSFAAIEGTGCISDDTKLLFFSAQPLNSNVKNIRARIFFLFFSPCCLSFTEHTSQIPSPSKHSIFLRRKIAGAPGLLCQNFNCMGIRPYGMCLMPSRFLPSYPQKHSRAPLAPPPQNHREISLTPDQSPVFALL